MKRVRLRAEVDHAAETGLSGERQHLRRCPIIRAEGAVGEGGVASPLGERRPVTLPPSSWSAATTVAQPWMHGVSLLNFTGDKISLERNYVVESSPAPEWRAKWRSSSAEGNVLNDKCQLQW